MYNAGRVKAIRDHYTPRWYEEYVRIVKKKHENDPKYGKPLDPLEFTAARLRLSVEEARSMTEDEWFKPHLAMAKAILTSKNRSFLSPIIISTEILDLKGTPRYRMADAGPAGGAPSARYVPELLAIWEGMVAKGIAEHQHSDTFTRWLFTMRMSDAFMCLSPFAEGNRRTNWFQLQTMRSALDLPYIMWRYEDAEDHDDRIDIYRWLYFVPWMKERNYM